MATTRPNEHERTLDEEGVPDLEGPMPAKAATGDPQEGMAPPNEQPRASVDYGVTADEQRRPEPLDRRLAREEPDVDGAVGGRPREELQMLAAHGTGPDDEKDEVADAVRADGTLGPEESAVRIEPESGTGRARERGSEDA